MDFGKGLTALHFQSFIVNLSKVMLLYRFQLKTSLRRDCSLLECVPGWVPRHEGIDSPEGNVKTSNSTFTSNFVA